MAQMEANRFKTRSALQQRPFLPFHPTDDGKSEIHIDRAVRDKPVRTAQQETRACGATL